MATMHAGKGKRYNKARCTLIICHHTASSSKSLDEICAQRKYLPHADTFRRWIADGGEECRKYAQAKDAQADYLAFETIYIADTEKNPNKARNMIDARKWIASHLNPRKYGDKLELGGSIDVQTRDVRSLETALAISALLQSIADRAGLPSPGDPPRQIEHAGQDDTGK